MSNIKSHIIKRGIFIRCDVPMKQFLLHLNNRPDFYNFVLEDKLDEMTLFIKEIEGIDIIAKIKAEIIKWQRENSFEVNPNA